MSDRRSEYRIQFGGGLAAQSIRLHVPGLHPLEGRLIDVSGHGASVVVQRSGISVRDLRQLVDVEFYGGEFPSPVRVGAKILYANEEASYLRCGLQFVAPDNLRSLLPKDLWKMFNRRQEMRLQFGTDSPAEVFVEGPGSDGALRGLLYDLSPTGICVLMDHTDARAFEIGEDASAYFTLPGQWRQLVAEPADHLAQDVLLLGEIEIHACSFA